MLFCKLVIQRIIYSQSFYVCGGIHLRLNLRAAPSFLSVGMTLSLNWLRRASRALFRRPYIHVRELAELSGSWSR